MMGNETQAGAESSRFPVALVPRRVSSVRDFPVEEESVLLDGRDESLVALNAPGRAVWELCDGSRSIADICMELSRRFEVSADAILVDVRNVLADLSGRDLIAIHPSKCQSDRDESATTIRIAFQSTYVLVQTDREEIASWLRRRYRPLLSDEPGRVIGRIDISRIGVEYHVDGCEDLPEPTRSAYEALRGVKHQIDRCFLEAHPRLVWVHAAAVSLKGDAVLLAGSYGAGKSTLACGLCDRGWKYLSDDIIPLDPASRRAYPFPLTPTYRVSEGRHVSKENVGDLNRIWVDLAPGMVTREPAPIRGIVFPAYDSDREPSLDALGPASTLVGLAANCMNFIHHGGDVLRVLADFVEGSKAFALSYADAEEAARLVGEAFES